MSSERMLQIHHPLQHCVIVTIYTVLFQFQYSVISISTLLSSRNIRPDEADQSREL